MDISYVADINVGAMLVIAIWIGFLIATCVLAYRKNLSVIGYGILSLFTCPLALIIVLFVPAKKAISGKEEVIGLKKEINIIYMLMGIIAGGIVVGIGVGGFIGGFGAGWLGSDIDSWWCGLWLGAILGGIVFAVIGGKVALLLQAKREVKDEK